MRMRFLQKRMGARAEGGVSGRQGSRPRKPVPGPPGRAPADGHVHLQHRGVMPLQGGQDAEQVRGPQVEEANHQRQQQQNRLPLGGHWALLEQEERPQGQGQVHCWAEAWRGRGRRKGPQGVGAGGAGRHSSPTQPVFKPHRKGGGRQRSEDGTQVSEKKVKREARRQENKETL